MTLLYEVIRPLVTLQDAENFYRHGCMLVIENGEPIAIQAEV